MDTKTYIGIIIAAVMVASVFAMTVSMVSATPEGATFTGVTKTTPPPPSSPGENTTEGGWIIEANLNTDSWTERWAGYYGNVTGNLSLGTAAGDLFTWSWTPANEGEVIASTASTGIAWDSLVNGTGSEVDTMWGFTGSDTGANTFTGSDTFTIGDRTMTGCPAADTLGAGGYKTGVINDGATAAKDDFLFAVNIKNNAATFDGGVHDYEIIVPTDDAIGATETYYFYVELV